MEVIVPVSATVVVVCVGILVVCVAVSRRKQPPLMNPGLRVDKYYRGILSIQCNIGEHFTVGLVEIAKMIVSSWSTVQVHYNSKSFFEIGTPFYKAFTV